jgi:putative transposase
MTKEAFLAILERHRKSGLSIKKFCRNEAYYPATFYYWKSKFCSSSSNVSVGSGTNNHIEDFAPVRFPAPQRTLSSSTTEDLSHVNNEIKIELPSGINIHFSGSACAKSAMRLITQMYSDHVLSQ